MLARFATVIMLVTAGCAWAASPSPTGLTLDPSCDTGVSGSDFVTNLDNSDPSKVLTFSVTGTVPGAKVDLYFSGGGTLLGSAIATGTTTKVVTDGVTRLGGTNVIEQINAQQTVPGHTISPFSSNAVIFVAVDAFPPPAPPGMLDRSFGSNGRVHTLFNVLSSAQAVAVQADGKIVIGGETSAIGQLSDFALVRYLTDGTLDTGFGTAGKVSVDFSSRQDLINALTVLSDGRILVVGYSYTSNYSAAVARLNSDGTLDTSFNGTGKALFNFGTSISIFNGMAVQTDGKILVCGQYDTGSVVARLNTDGTLDTGFGSSGKVLISGGFAAFKSIKLMSDGRFYAAGGQNGSLVLYRFNADGSLDTSFGSGGNVTPLRIFSNTSIATCMDLQSDGNIVVAGYCFIPGTFQEEFALARYDSSGNLDSGFGSSGIVTTSVTNHSDQILAIALQSDGKIVAVGQGQDFTAVRYNTNGTLDSTFGIGGMETTAITNVSTSQANAVAIQSDGRIVVVGQAGRLNGYDIAVVRYLTQRPAQCIALDPASDTGVIGDNSTAIANPTLDVQSSDLYYRIYDNGEQVSNDYETTTAFVITPLSDGTHTITVCAVDSAGNVSAPGNPLMLTITAGAPEILMTYSPPTPVFNDVIQVSIQFSKPVAGFDATDIHLTNATFVSLSGSGSDYTLNISPAAVGSATVYIPGASAFDIDGVGNVRARLSIPIGIATPTVTWNAPANLTYGDTLSGTTLDATADVPGTFAYTPPAGSVLNAGQYTLSCTFTPTSPNYKSVTVTVPLTVDKASPTITWADPADVVYGTALSATQLNATANVPGTLVYSPTAGTLLNAGLYILSVDVTPQDLSNYLRVSAHVIQNVLPAATVITWPQPAPIVYGTALSSMQLNATASAPGTFNYSPGSGTILPAGLQTLKLHFAPDSSNYTVVDTSIILTVAKQTVLATWANPAEISEATALSGVQLNAQANVPGNFVYDPPAGTFLTPGSHSLTAVFTPTDTVDYGPPGVLSVSIKVAALPLLQSVQIPSVLLVRQAGDFVAQASGYLSPTVLWNFGDGITASGGAVTHSFAVAGSYNVTAAALDVLGGETTFVQTVIVLPLGSGSSTDSDGDGFPDIVEQAAGTSPLDGSNTPFGGASAGTPQLLNVTKLSISLNCESSSNDSISISGLLPFNAKQTGQLQQIIIDVGGVVQVMNLKSGSTLPGANQFKLSLNKRAKMTLFKAQLKGAFASTLAQDGLTAEEDISKAPRSVVVNVYCDNQQFQAFMIKSWSAKKGKNGRLH